MGSSSRHTTVDSILDAAEELFAAHGFAQTSLRAITGRANVNLAAVNYHFGSKEALIQAVFERALTPFAQALSQALNDLPAQASLETLMDTLAQVGQASFARSPEKAMTFLRLCALAYTQGQGHLRRFLTEQFGDVHTQFLRHLSQAVPTLSPMEIYWRVHFGLGSLIFTLSGLEALQAICKAEYGEELSYEQVNQRLVAFVIGGIRATLTETAMHDMDRVRHAD